MVLRNTKARTTFSVGGRAMLLYVVRIAYNRIGCICIAFTTSYVIGLRSDFGAGVGRIASSPHVSPKTKSEKRNNNLYVHTTVEHNLAIVYKGRCMLSLTKRLGGLCKAYAQ